MCTRLPKEILPPQPSFRVAAIGVLVSEGGQVPFLSTPRRRQKRRTDRTDRRTNSAAFPRIRERRANLRSRSLARWFVRRRFCVDTLHTWSYDVDGDVDGSRRWSEGKRRRDGGEGGEGGTRGGDPQMRSRARAGERATAVPRSEKGGFPRYHLEKAPPNICCRCFCKLGQFSQNALTK